jgi:putative ABC transport system permease protein
MVGIALKFDPAVRSSLFQRIQDVAIEVMGGPMQGVFFGEDRLATAFQQEKMESRLLLACGLLAMLLSCIGLYGLTSFTMKHRTKEVGVRKVLGSTVGSLVRLFLWRFAKPILAASLVASPVAVYFALRWIQRFPYQLDKVWLLPICLVTVAAVLLVALLTVIMLTTRAAMTRPVKSLRYE